MIYEIYKATSPSGKCYIGLTKDFNNRILQHFKEAKNIKSKTYNSIFKTAIRKYGENNITWQIIDRAKDKNTAKELEIRYILQFNSYISGYNMTEGGDSVGKSLKWTKDKILLEAIKYSSISEWINNSEPSFAAAKRLKKKDKNSYIEFTKHMKPCKYSDQDIIDKVKNFKSKIEWKTKCRYTYQKACKNKELFSECVKHMVKK